MNSNIDILKVFKSIGKQKALVALIVLFIVMSFATPNFLTIKNLTDLLYHSVTYSILALGVTLTIVAAACDLSIGGTMVFAGVIMIGLQQYIPIWFAGLLAILAGAVIGFINGFFSVHQKTEPFIITLGMGILLRGVVMQLTDGRPISGTNMAYVNLGNKGIKLAEGMEIPYLVIIGIVMIVLFHLLLTRTSYGRNLYAIGGDYNVAVYSGINAMKQKWMAFVISGITAAIGGILLSARFNSASAIYGDQTALIVNCSVVVGGTSFAGAIGGIWQSVVGVFLLQVIETSMNLLGLSSYTQKAIEGILIVLIIGMDLYSIKRKAEKV
jgi:ribose/xylose/arabinose/galactoside ABC-type transport system permease subunit